MVKIAVLGYGTVGSGVVEVIERNRELIEKRAGKRLEVKYILDIRDFPGDPYEDRIVHDVERILEDPEVEIICETMGGMEPAYTLSQTGAGGGKERLHLQQGAGGCPRCPADRPGGRASLQLSVRSQRRWRNSHHSPFKLRSDGGESGGNCRNFKRDYQLYINQDGKGRRRFGTVLKEAQQKGYAERNPEADVEGYDACRKIAILTSLIAGHTVDFHEIHTEGITGITPEDFEYAKAMDMTIKLLAASREEEGGYLASVVPCMLKKEMPLALVSGCSMPFPCGEIRWENPCFTGKGPESCPRPAQWSPMWWTAPDIRESI